MFGPHVHRDFITGRKRPFISEQIAAARAQAAGAGIDMRAVQIFVAGPKNRTLTLKEDEGIALRKYLATTGIWAVAHGTYMDNPWRGDAHAAMFIRQEAAAAGAAGIEGLVVHLGAPGPDDVAEYAPRLLSEEGPGRDVRIYLETPHLLPKNSHYETPEKLRELFQRLRERFGGAAIDAGFGLCVDTAHLWSCGVDLRTYRDAQEWFEGLDEIADVMPPRGVMLHLNDSLNERGSGLDHHGPLLGGNIWGEYRDDPRRSGLAAVVDYALEHQTPVILERKPKEALVDDYQVIWELAPSARLEN